MNGFLVWMIVVGVVVGILVLIAFVPLLAMFFALVWAIFSNV
jgi:hypothetical protein